MEWKNKIQKFFETQVFTRILEVKTIYWWYSSYPVSAGLFYIHQKLIYPEFSKKEKKRKEEINKLYQKETDCK